MRALAFGLLALVFALSGAARADEAPNVQAIISSQLDAFAHDDARAAFSLAAPPIQRKFESPEAFIAMVKAAYPPVYRHRSVQFGQQSREGGKIQQGVVFVDSDNDVWAGVYSLARQSDGGWKIVGCVIARSNETSL
jgi:hypothetical protein